VQPDVRPRIQRCLLTGASGGIGAALAQVLAEQGITLILQGRELTKLEALQQRLPGQHELVVADLTLAEDRQRLLTQAFAPGHIDCLINNAGASAFSDFTALPPGDIEAMLALNLTAPILLTRAYLQQMAGRTATVVNVGSVLGAIGLPGFGVYAATKFGLRGFTEALMREYADTDTRIAYFAPRTTATESNSAAANAMNTALGNAVDSPTQVAAAFMTWLNGRAQRRTVGWPEKLLVRLNGLLPELVDRVLKGQLAEIKKHTAAAAQE